MTEKTLTVDDARRIWPYLAENYEGLIHQAVMELLVAKGYLQTWNVEANVYGPAILAALSAAPDAQS